MIVSVVLGVLAACLVGHIVGHYLEKLHRPPGPWGIPLLGSLWYSVWLTLRGQRPPLIEYWHKMGLKYAASTRGVWSDRLGMIRIVHLNSFDAVKEALVDHGDIFAGRPNHYMYQRHCQHRGIIMAEGDLWRVHRRFALAVFRDFGFGKARVEHLVLEEAETWVQELLKNHNGNSAGIRIRPRETVVKAVANVICTLVFGEKWGYHNPQFEELIHHVRIITQTTGPMHYMEMFYPTLAKLGVFHWFGLKDQIGESDAALAALMDAKFEEVQSRFDAENEEATNYLEAFLKQMQRTKDEGNGSTFTRGQAVRSCLDLFAAGTDTTTNGICWTLLYLALHPEVQNKVHRELDLVLGTEADLNLLNSTANQLRSQLHYFNAVLDESQRRASVLFHSVDKRVMQSTTFRGYSIRDSDLVMPNLYNVHHDPQHWSHAHQFQPERFLDSQGHYRPNPHLIPFGIGRRVCLGENLARLEMFLFTMNLLKRFTVHLAPEYDNEVTLRQILIGSEGITHGPGDFELILTSRG